MLFGRRGALEYYGSTVDSVHALRGAMRSPLGIIIY